MRRVSLPAKGRNMQQHFGINGAAGCGEGKTGIEKVQMLDALHTWQMAYADYEMKHGNACLAEAV